MLFVRQLPSSGHSTLVRQLQPSNDYANHKKSINSPRYSNETELSKYAWKLKQSNRPYTIKWSVLSHHRQSRRQGLETQARNMMTNRDIRDVPVT